MIFVLRPNYSQSALLQFDLNGVSADGTLLGLTSSRPEGRSGNSGIAGGAFCDAAVDEETIMGVLLDEFLSTTAVRGVAAHSPELETLLELIYLCVCTGAIVIQTSVARSPGGAFIAGMFDAEGALPSGLAPVL